jgi:hypothetical protein
VEIIRIERFRTFVKYLRTVEKYMAAGNQNWMVFRDRWEWLKAGTKNKQNITNANYTVSIKCI